MLVIRRKCKYYFERNDSYRITNGAFYHNPTVKGYKESLQKRWIEAGTG